MIEAVRIVRLAVENVGVHAGRVEVGDLSPRLNIISGGNETGKSTLIEALRVALFERHDAKHQGIRTLQPHGTRAAPEIWVDLEIGAERYCVYKRFLDKPTAELRDAPEGPVRLRGADVDRLLWQQLGGHAPKKQGGRPRDMGVWGLLWVTQDETAYSDPIGLLDDDKERQEEVRGALAEVISRQVGQITGGRHGERVRTRVLEHLGQFFTDKTGSRTGAYRKATEEKEAADELVARIERGLRESEDLAQQYAHKLELLHQLDREGPKLEQEHLAIRRAVEHAANLQLRTQEARANRDAAESRYEALEKDAAAREVLRTEAERARQEVRRQTAGLADLGVTHQQQKEDAEIAAQESQEETATVARLSQELGAVSQYLERERRTAEVRELSQRIDRAQRLAEQLRTELRRASDTIDQPTFEQLQSLSERAQQLRTRIETSGTRMVVRRAEERQVYPVGIPWTGEIPDVGVLEIEPARPGLGLAVDRARQARAKLEGALQENGVTDLQQARDQRAEGQAVDSEIKGLKVRLAKLAAEGVEALAQEVAAQAGKLASLELALDHAQRDEIERVALQRQLAENPVDETTIRNLREGHQRLVAERTACALVGTHLELHARQEVHVSIGDGPMQRMQADERSGPHAVTAQTIIRVGDLIDLVLEPRGEDLVKARSRLERAESELRLSMAPLGVQDLAGAEELASSRARLQVILDIVLQRLASCAPDGQETLRSEAEQQKALCQRLERNLQEARGSSARVVQLEEKRHAIRVDKAALSRLDKYNKELTECEAIVGEHAARVRCLRGPLGEHLRSEQAGAVSAPLLLRLSPDLHWELIPGECAEGLELARAEQALAMELERLGVPDLDVAATKWKAGLLLQPRLTELEQQIQAISPGGLDNLRAVCDAKQEALGKMSCDRIDIPAGLDATAWLEQLQGQHRTGLSRAQDAGRRTLATQAAFDDTDQELRRLREQRDTEAARHQVLTEYLATALQAESDGALQLRVEQARQEYGNAQKAHETTAGELEAAAPQLLQDEEERAEQTIGQWRKRREELQAEVVKLKTLLDKAASEGRFEQLMEACSAQTAAASELAFQEREARAARLLATAVQRAYDEAQQRFLAPVLKETAPYVRVLRPGTELRMTPNLKLEKVARYGTEEDFGQLSGGTREQLAVIVRLALARVLAKDQRPLPLILDDPMGWTDDARFLSMVRIVRDAARELQTIILTCHPERFIRFQAEFTFDLDQKKRGQILCGDSASESS